MLKTASDVTPPFCETLYFYRSIYFYFFMATVLKIIIQLSLLHHYNDGTSTCI